MKADWRQLIYISLLIPVLGGCIYNEIPSGFDCTSSALAVSVATKQDASSCKSIDGSITVAGSGGKEPYSFSLNGGEFQTHNQFTNLGSGSYLVTIKDENNCERSLQVDVGAANSSLTATFTTSADNQCLSDNGSITVTASGGNAPYQYGWASGAFGSNNVLTNLKSGQYTVIVKDANDCQKVISVQVPHGNTGISYASVIKPIMDTNCNIPNCHKGGALDWTVFANVKLNAASIKFRTGNRSMPIDDKKLTQEEIDKIACWVDDGANNN